MTWRTILLSLILIGSCQWLGAKDVPSPPNPPRLVNDYAGILSQGEIERLERKLVAYDDSTSTQIAIVIERTIEGDDIADYSYRLGTAWGIGGDSQKNNGVLIFVAFEDRDIFILTGTGVQGFLPDAIAKRIIENALKPQFRNQQYYRGFEEATDIIIALGNGEYVREGGRNSGDEGGGIPLIFVILFIVLVFIILSRIGGRGGDDDDDDGGYYRGGRYDMDDRRRGRRSRGGGWIFIPGPGGWNSGGGGGGGGGWDMGGGGFGGFGGGGFDGGGAGGSW